MLEQLTQFNDITPYSTLLARLTGLAIGSGKKTLLDIVKFWNAGDYYNSFRCLALTFSIVFDVRI